MKEGITFELSGGKNQNIRQGKNRVKSRRNESCTIADGRTVLGILIFTPTRQWRGVLCNVSIDLPFEPMKKNR